jgi:hypothetical protein
VQERQAEKTYHQLRNVPFANNAMPMTVERSRELPVTSNNHAMGSVAMTTMATLKSLINASPIRTQPSVSPDPKTVYVNNHSNHSQVGKSQKVSIIQQQLQQGNPMASGLMISASVQSLLPVMPLGDGPRKIQQLTEISTGKL